MLVCTQYFQMTLFLHIVHVESQSYALNTLCRERAYCYQNCSRPRIESHRRLVSKRSTTLEKILLSCSDNFLGVSFKQMSKRNVPVLVSQTFKEPVMSEVIIQWSSIDILSEISISGMEEGLHRSQDLIIRYPHDNPAFFSINDSNHSP